MIMLTLLGSFETENKNDNPVEKSISDETQESVENSISDETQGPEEPQEPDGKFTALNLYPLLYIAVEKASEEEDNDAVFPDGMNYIIILIHLFNYSEPETQETSDNSEVAGLCTISSFP